jgi:hypothetical protein
VYWRTARKLSIKALGKWQTNIGNLVADVCLDKEETIVFKSTRKKRHRCMFPKSWGHQGDFTKRECDDKNRF